jgi:hypothetical protein
MKKELRNIHKFKIYIPPSPEKNDESRNNRPFLLKEQLSASETSRTRICTKVITKVILFHIFNYKNKINVFF